ncbi:hypothetical protein LC612_36710 [Nostoc sp. CHAB 5834]|nr:hypothetical protein [Nostoc sp. CHAB 5834]
MAASIRRPGTTDGITDFQANISWQFSPSPKGAPCPFQTVQAQVNATKLVVYIAREITPKDCRFKVVYDHEMQHVVLAQKAMDKSVGLLRQHIRALMASLTPQQLSNAEAIAEKLESLKANSIDALYADYNEGNARLDTPAEGERMTKLCEEPKFYVGGKELN